MGCKRRERRPAGAGQPRPGHPRRERPVLVALVPLVLLLLLERLWQLVRLLLLVLLPARTVDAAGVTGGRAVAAKRGGGAEAAARGVDGNLPAAAPLPGHHSHGVVPTPPSTPWGE